MPRLAVSLHALALAALAAFPWVGGEYYVELVVHLMIFAVLAMSLDLLVGGTGMISFGHAAFYGLGAYGLALLTPAAGGATVWLALPVCVGAAAAAALVIGALSVRTSGVYFIMITLAFAQMLFYLAVENGALGGSDGLFVSRPTVALGGLTLLDLDDPPTFYYAVLAALVAAYVLLRVILAAPFGRVIRAVRLNEQRTRALGYPVRRYKLASFVIAGALAGFAGVLEAAHGGYVSPGLLSWHQSGIVLMVVILGGTGTVWGPALGAFAFGLLQDQLQDVTEHAALFVGLFVILVVLLLPDGMASLGRRLTGREPPA